MEGEKTRLTNQTSKFGEEHKGEKDVSTDLKTHKNRGVGDRSNLLQSL